VSKERARVSTTTILMPYQELRNQRVVSRRLIEPLERDMGEHSREPRDSAIDLEHEYVSRISLAVFEERLEILRRDVSTGAKPMVDRSLGVLQLRDAVDERSDVRGAIRAD